MKAFFVVLLLTANAAAAQPSIEEVFGTISHDSTLTIIGSEFGLKAVPQPYKWETFEAGESGQSIFPNSFWYEEHGGENTTYSGMYPRHTNSSLSARHVVGTVEGDPGGPQVDEFSVVMDELNTPGSKLFLSAWLRVDFVSGYDNPSSQMKVMRIASGTGYDVPPAMLWQSFINNEQSMSQSFITAYGSGGYSDYLGGGIGRGDPVNGGMPRIAEHIWVNLQVSYQNSVAPATTTCRFLVSPTSGGAYDGAEWVNVSPIQSSTGPFCNAIKLGYHDNAAELAINHWDDIYIDHTWARVEIGNNAIYSLCSIREMQIPNYWSDGRIEVGVNLGLLNGNQDLWLFVVDSEELVSTGFPIVSGQGTIVPGIPGAVSFDQNN